MCLSQNKYKKTRVLIKKEVWGAIVEETFLERQVHKAKVGTVSGWRTLEANAEMERKRWGGETAGSLSLGYKVAHQYLQAISS